MRKVGVKHLAKPAPPAARRRLLHSHTIARGRVGAGSSGVIGGRADGGGNRCLDVTNRRRVMRRYRLVPQAERPTVVNEGNGVLVGRPFDVAAHAIDAVAVERICAGNSNERDEDDHNNRRGLEDRVDAVGVAERERERM